MHQAPEIIHSYSIKDIHDNILYFFISYVRITEVTKAHNLFNKLWM